MVTIKNDIADKDLSEFLAVLDKYKQKVIRSKASSRKFLVELGVVTEIGKLTKQYEHLYIPQVQAYS